MATPSSSLILLLLLFLTGVRSVTFTITNNCNHPVWPGLLSGAGTDPLSTTGFALDEGQFQTVVAPAKWSGRLWGRTLCSTDDAGKFTCLTGDCGSGQVECAGGGAAPPTTLAEFTLDGGGGMDFYDVSLVDGYNLPMLVVPQGGSAGNCTVTGCLADVNKLCPAELKVTAEESAVACKSACDVFGLPEYCCNGEFGNPQTCRPTAYSEVFKNACPRAYSYAYDDGSSTFTCGGADGYAVTFCPSISSGAPLGDDSKAVPLTNDSLVYLGRNLTGDATTSLASFAISVTLGVLLALLEGDLVQF